MAEVLAPQAPQQAVADSQQEPCLAWWELLASLKDRSVELLPLLEQAVGAVANDAQWNTSGVPELLKRALDMAKRGSLVLARQNALNLLDFQLMAQRYRLAAKAHSGGAGGSSGEGSGPKKEDLGNGATSSSSTSSDVASTDMHHEGAPNTSCGGQLALDRLATISMHRSDSAEPSTGVNTPTSTSSGLVHEAPVFSVPEPPSKRRRLVPTDSAAERLEGRLHFQTPQLPHAASSSDTRASSGTQEWAGVLGLVAEDGGRASDLCHASMQLPRAIMRNMPRSLHFTHLVQRRGVMLGNYQVVRTTIKKANMRQMSRLRSMAQHELVAVAALERLHVIMVPYMDNNGELKLVSFALNT